MLLMLTLGAPGCQPRHYEWQGPTAAFKRIDATQDGELSRAEWQVRNWQTNLHTWEAGVFEQADCDSNGRLTWREYFRGVIKLRYCLKPYIFHPALSREELNTRAFFPMPLTDPEFGALRLFDLSRPEQLIREVASTFPIDIYESLIDSSAEVSCTDDGHTLILMSAGPYHQPHRTATCSVVNPSTQNAITLLLLRIRVEFSDGSETTWHAKPIYLQPESAMKLVVVLPAEGLSSNITLEHVRGISGLSPP